MCLNINDIKRILALDILREQVRINMTEEKPDDFGRVTIDRIQMELELYGPLPSYFFRHTFLYTPIWKIVSRHIRRRDNNTCQLCGARGIDKNEMNVHHFITRLDGFKIYKTDKHVYDPWNMVTVCKTCHGWLEQINAHEYYMHRHALKAPTQEDLISVSKIFQADSSFRIFSSFSCKM